MLGDDGLELLAVGFHVVFLGGSPGYTQIGVGNDAVFLKVSVFSCQPPAFSCQIWIHFWCANCWKKCLFSVAYVDFCGHY
jgi:hypothetical protein